MGVFYETDVTITNNDISGNNATNQAGGIVFFGNSTQFPIIQFFNISRGISFFGLKDELAAYFNRTDKR